MSDVPLNFRVDAQDAGAGSLFDSLGGKIGGLANVAGTVAVGGLVALGTALVGAGVAAISSNSQFEQYGVQFETLIGNSEDFKAANANITDPLQLQALAAQEAQARLDDLAQFGASTPFELPQVVEADRILQGFGLHSKQAAEDFGFSGEQIRTIAGDVAAGTGVDFQEMALQIGKFSKGATGESIARFMELGVLTRDELAKMGVEFSKSGELISPLPEATNAMLTLMQQKYGGLMDAQSATFGGMLSNLQDWVSGTLRELGQPLFDVAKDQLSGLLTFLNDPATQAGIASFTQSLATGIAETMSFITTTVIPAFVTGWGVIGPVIGTVVGIVSGLAAALSSGATSGGLLTEATSFLGSTWQTVQAIIAAVVPIVQSVVTTGLGIVQGFIAEHGTQIQSLLQMAWQTVQMVVSTTLAVIQNVVIPILSGIASFIAAHSAEIQAVLNGAWQVISSIIETTLGVIQGICQTVMAAISGDWDGAWQGVQRIVQSIGSGIEGVISGYMTAYQNIISLAWSAVQSITSSVWASIRDEVNAIATGIASWVGTKFEEAKTLGANALNGLLTSVSGLAGSFASAALTLGSGIINGIISGVVGGVGALIDAVVAAGAAALNAAKEFLGIASPSRVFADVVGLQIPAGVAVGIEANLSPIDAALSTMRERLVAPLEVGMGGGVLAPVAPPSGRSATGSGGMTIMQTFQIGAAVPDSDAKRMMRIARQENERTAGRADVRQRIERR